MIAAQPATPMRPLLPASLAQPPSSQSKLTMQSMRLSTVMTASAAPSLSATHSGPLCKRSHPLPFWPKSKREWKFQWCLIDRRDRRLKLYPDSEVTRKPDIKPKKSYDLIGAVCLVKENDNASDDDCGGRARASFVLSLSNNKKMEIGCESKQMRQEYVAFIQLAATSEFVDNDSNDKENDSKSSNPPPKPPKKPVISKDNNSASGVALAPAASGADVSKHEWQSPVRAESVPATPAKSTAVSKALALGAIPVLPSRSQLPATVDSKPALPSSSPKPARMAPTQSPPPTPSKPQLPTIPTPSHQQPVAALPATVVEPEVEQPLSPSTSPEQAAEAERLQAVHTKQLEHASSVGSLAWDDVFQNTLRQARSTTNSNDAVIKATALQTHLNDFKRTSTYWARRIIDEYSLPIQYKTVRPVSNDDSEDKESHRYLIEGIIFEFAQAGLNDEEATIRATIEGRNDHESEENAKLADTLASKQATAELHSIQALLSCNQLNEELCLPLMALVDYLGFRIRCVATIPIYDHATALVWGDSDSGEFRCQVRALSLLEECAAALNIAPYDSASGYTIPLSSRVAVYASNDSQRYYITRLQTMMPCDLDVQYTAQYDDMEPLWQTKTFRPEFLAHTDQPLSSDAYRREIAMNGSDYDSDESEDDSEDYEANAAKASKRLQKTSIPRFVKELERYSGGNTVDLMDGILIDIDTDNTSFSDKFVYSCLGSSYILLMMDGDDLCAAMHEHAIPLRYLGRIAELTRQPHIRMLAIVEMCARQCKTLLTQNLRTLQRTIAARESQGQSLSLVSHLLFQSTITARLQSGAVDFLNLVCGNSHESQQFWQLLLFPDLQIKYRLSAQSPLTLDAIKKAIHMPLLFQTIQQRCGLLCKARMYQFNSDKPVDCEDFIGFDSHCKTIQPALSVHQSVMKAKLNVSKSPFAVSESEWSIYCKAMEIELTLHSDVSPMTALPTARLSTSEARRRLKRYNELMYGYLQCQSYQQAQQCQSKVQSIVKRLSYSSALLAAGNHSGPSSAAEHPTSFGHHAEHARYLINSMWLAILDQSDSLSDKDRRKLLTDLFVTSRDCLTYHVGLVHPLMLSLHYTLATYHIHHGSSQSANSQAIKLLEHCHGFAHHLFTTRKPLTMMLAGNFARQVLKGAAVDQYSKARQWLQSAQEACRKALESKTKERDIDEREQMARIRDHLTALTNELDAAVTHSQ